MASPITVKVRTILIIITLEEKVEVDYSTAIFGKEKKIQKATSQRYEIDKPTIVFPEGYDGKLEVIPIRGNTTIRTKDFKREISP